MIVRPPLGLEPLLRAALWADEVGLDAWTRWRATNTPRSAPPAVRRTLPLIYKNLSTFRPRSPLIATLEPIYIDTWGENRARWARVRPALKRAHDAGVELMLLKGLALAETVYRDWGLRPMGDIDVLVRPEKARLALDALIEAGFRPQLRARVSGVETLLATEHAVALVHPEAPAAIDLHWRALLQCAWTGADEPLWRGARPVMIDGLAARVPAPTEQLLHVLAHGAFDHIYNDARAAQWVLDAASLLQSHAEEIRWSELVGQAHDRKFGLLVSDALRYLSEHLHLPVPIRVIDALEQSSPSLAELLELVACDVDDPELRSIVISISRYLRIRRVPNYRGVRGPVRYMKEAWGMERTRQVLLQLGPRLSRRLGARRSAKRP